MVGDPDVADAVSCVLMMTRRYSCRHLVWDFAAPPPRCWPFLLPRWSRTSCIAAASGSTTSAYICIIRTSAATARISNRATCYRQAPEPARHHRPLNLSHQSLPPAPPPLRLAPSMCLSCQNQNHRVTLDGYIRLRYQRHQLQQVIPACPTASASAGTASGWGAVL